MNLKFHSLIMGLLLTAAPTVFAELQDYEVPKLLARANIQDGHNLPPLSFLSNTSPVINNRGDISFKLMSVNGENNQALWLKLKDEENGKIIHKAEELKFISDPSLNDLGIVTFNQYDNEIPEGIFTFDGQTGAVGQILEPNDQDISFYTYPQVTTDGSVFFRGTDAENTRTFFRYSNNKLLPIIAEGNTSFGEKSSYLFKPSLNDSGAMSFKRRVGDKGEWGEEQGDEILMLKPNGLNYDSVIIARDRDLDKSSPYIGFTNATSISKSGMVAFVGVLEDTRKAIVLYKEGKLINLALEKENDILEIELFSPKLNDRGQVLFRAIGMDGKRGIYLVDKVETKKIIAEGDEVETDLGPGKILSNPNYPGFGGEVDMNDLGEIVFYCLVVGSTDEKEWGSGVYKISPKK